MDVLDAIGSRVSAVRLTEPGPAHEQIDIILKAAVRAPDHGRLSPWGWIVIEGMALERLGQAYIDLKRRSNPENRDFDRSIEIAKAFRAPTLIAVGVSIPENPK